MPGEVLQHFTRTRILNKPMNMQLMGDAPAFERSERRPGGRDGERRGNGAPRGEGAPRRFSERREGGREGGRFNREGGRGPRREEGASAPRRRDA